MMTDEALRAKILFAEGAHKVGGQRPKFQRQQLTRMPELSRVASLEPSNEYLDVPEFLRRDCSDSDLGESPASTWYNKNFGVDISTLASMIEQGQL